MSSVPLSSTINGYNGDSVVYILPLERNLMPRWYTFMFVCANVEQPAPNFTGISFDGIRMSCCRIGYRACGAMRFYFLKFSPANSTTSVILPSLGIDTLRKCRFPGRGTW